LEVVDNSEYLGNLGDFSLLDVRNTSDYGRNKGRNTSKRLESSKMTIAIILRKLRRSTRKNGPALALLLISFVPSALLAKGPATKITIESPKFARPIEITDPVITKQLQVFSSLIVDWASGAVTPPAGLETYPVSFHVEEYAHPYVVLYAPDPSGKQGYVYLPGKEDEWYRTNIGMIWRHVEGQWFRALAEWEDLARPLIEKQRHSSQ
jgi:hypothetical protein